MEPTLNCQEVTQLRGALTERDLCLAEDEFPGITRFYFQCTHKPATFLELARAFQCFRPISAP